MDLHDKQVWSVKISLFFVVLSWFSYTLYRFQLAITTQFIPFTDVPATVGLGFRTAAGLIALVVAIFFLVRRDLSPIEVMISLRLIVIFEALYFFSFLWSAIWGFDTVIPQYPREILLYSTGFPCLLEAVLIPIVLFKLFFELSIEKLSGAIKWGLISGVTYVFVYWFNYTMQWLATFVEKSTEIVTLYPINMFGLAITAGGLLILAIYAVLRFKGIFGKDKLLGHDLKSVGIVITAFGLFFDVTFLLWRIFGSGEGNMWHTFFIFHNVDLWCLALPLVGLPLILWKEN